mgnify:CR=1 FL=1
MIGLLGKDWGYTDASGNKVSALRDMFDGGGAGRYGDTFEGAPISGLLNNLGVRPHGYRELLSERNRPAAPRIPAPAPALTYGPQNGRGGRRPAVVARSPDQFQYPVVAPGGVNPVTAYDEAARFGLLAPAANVPYTVPQDIAANESRMNEMERRMVENALPYHLRDTYGVPTWAFHMGQN